MQNQGNGALSLLPPIGPSAQNATAPFVAADTAARGDMCVRSNQVHPVGPASARRPAIVVLPTYCQSAGTTGRILLVLVRHSVVSIATAWCLAYLFTLGNIFCGKSPSQQSYRSFLTATFVLGTVCLAQVMLMVQVISMSTLHRTESPTKLIPLLLLAWRFESQTFVAFILMEAVSVLITYAFASANETLRPWHFEFYLQTWVVGLHTAAVYVERKRIYQLETAEGCAVGRVNKMPYYKRYFNSYLQTSLNPIAISVAAFLVHGSLHLRITTNSELILMSLAGIFIKSTTLRAIKLIVLRKRKKIDSKGIYVFTVVPTVLINTQLRLLLLRARPQQTVWGFILLAILEPVLRFIKTKDVLRELQRQRRQGGVLTRRSSAMWQPVALAVAISTPNTSAATANPASPRTSNLQGRHEGNSPAQRNSSQTTRRQAYTQWRTTMLQFLAAELEADMCSEYIAIGCSLAINYFFQEHPHLGWKTSDDIIAGSKIDPLTSFGVAGVLSSKVALASFQVVLEVVVDFSCSMWELRQGIPLNGAPELHLFLTAIFTACTVGTVSVCAAIFAS